jgi:hypothetical protein
VTDERAPSPEATGVDLAALDARIARWQAERDARERAVRAPLWLTHHRPEQHDRCWAIARTLVCRRCSLLWPLAFVVMVLAGLGSWWPRGADPVLLVLLPLPGVVEFTLEHLGVLRYSSTRQLLLTVPIAVAIGRLLARYLDDQGDALFWAVVCGYALVLFGAAVVGHRRTRTMPT